MRKEREENWRGNIAKNVRTDNIDFLREYKTIVSKTVVANKCKFGFRAFVANYRID